MREQVIVPYPTTLEKEPAATHCRSTLLLASVNAMKRHFHYDAYARNLSAQHLEAITWAAPGSWIPIEVGVAHYRACDALGLPTTEKLRMGGDVVHALQKTFIGTVLKSASAGIGVTPIAGLEKFVGVYGRSIKGGGARVLQVGPKDARIDFVGLPFSAIDYFRVAYRGFIQAGCEFFSRRVVVAELEPFRTPTTCAYRIAWV